MPSLPPLSSKVKVESVDVDCEREGKRGLEGCGKSEGPSVRCPLKSPQSPYLPWQSWHYWQRFRQEEKDRHVFDQFILSFSAFLHRQKSILISQCLRKNFHSSRCRSRLECLQDDEESLLYPFPFDLSVSLTRLLLTEKTIPWTLKSMGGKFSNH